MHGNTSFSSKVLFKEVTSSAHFSTSFCKTPTSVLISCDAFWSASLNETSDDVHSSKTCFSVAVLYTSKGNRFAPMSFTISSGAPSLITYIHHTFHNVLCTLALCAHQHINHTSSDIAIRVSGFPVLLLTTNWLSRGGRAVMFEGNWTRVSFISPEPCSMHADVNATL